MTQFQLRRVPDEKVPSHLKEPKTNRHLNPADPIDFKIIKENIEREAMGKPLPVPRAKINWTKYVYPAIILAAIFTLVGWASLMFRYQISKGSEEDSYILDRWTGEVNLLRGKTKIEVNEGY
jgi:hypothetical protein